MHPQLECIKDINKKGKKQKKNSTSVYVGNIQNGETMELL
jgi:hypothetical protein